MAKVINIFLFCLVIGLPITGIVLFVIEGDYFMTVIYITVLVIFILWLKRKKG